MVFPRLRYAVPARREQCAAILHTHSKDKIALKTRILSFQGYSRRRWDSNPRAPEDNRISSAARYDHFDTSPQCQRQVF